MMLLVIAITHSLTALAFLVVIALLLTSRAQHRYKRLLLIASGATVLWAASVALGDVSTSNVWMPLAAIFEQARTLGWIAVAAFVLLVAYQKRIGRPVVLGLTAAMAACAIYVIALSIYAGTVGELTAGLVRSTFVARLGIAIIGLLAVENLFRNSGREARWAVKYLCFGVGIICAYDFFMYADAALVDHIDPRFYAARGVIAAMAAPLILIAAARSKSWPIDVHVSRQMVFHSATLLAAGSYLVLMALVGYSLRIFDSAWGTVAQATFLTASALVLAVILSSGQAQAFLKDFIARHFFSYKHDYRKEWLRFIAAISDSLIELTVPERALRALANIVESTGGALWTCVDDDNAFRPAALWNLGDGLPTVQANDPFLAALAQSEGVMNVRDQGDAALPAWLTKQGRARFVLPLLHLDKVMGFVVLCELRAARELSWEDVELLKTAGRQAASYLAEADAVQSLSRARRFEDFNQKFAFVAHDIKNLAGQMSLLLQNAEHHVANPEFQRDMLATIGHSVTRMRAMLEQLRNGSVAASRSAAPFDVTALLTELSDTWKLQISDFEIDIPDEAVHAVGDPERLGAVVHHLIQNASDAVSGKGHVSLELHIEGKSRSHGGTEHADDESWVVITVSDNGPGMDRAFIEQKLFEPLRSNKANGFGIGAFQVRQLIREMNGRLDVDSRLGSGTRMIVRLPLSKKLAAVKAPAAAVRRSDAELRASYG